MDIKNNLIYFNNNRTTKPDQDVLDKMAAMTGLPANDLKKEIEGSYQHLAQLLGCEPSEIIFTEGTSHSIQLALNAIFTLSSEKKPHIITTRVEHPAVLTTCKELELKGAEITYLSVDPEGLISLDELKRTLRPSTILVSVMAANNETGVIQPIEEISKICQTQQVLFFSDASQYVGKMRTDVTELGMDLLAFGAHKMYGPKGIGALYISNKQPALKHLIEQTNQGIMESSAMVGFGKAAELSLLNYWETTSQISKLKNYFEHQLLDIDGLRINGSTRHRLYNTSNLTFPKTLAVSDLLKDYEFAHNLSKPSYVLSSMGLSPEEIEHSYRFSFGKNNSLEEVKGIVEKIKLMNLT